LISVEKYFMWKRVGKNRKLIVTAEDEIVGKRDFSKVWKIF